MNDNRKVSIATLEDPIEFVHPNKKSLVHQREIGVDVPDYNTGLIQALRQDPDVILLGELRDVDTIRTAIKAAETGHLVFTTLHTTNAIQTVERVIGTFPETEHDLVREQLSTNLKAVISQNLVKRKEGKGRYAAQEILVVTGMISKLIADNRISDIFGVMKGREDGMQTYDQALADLVRAGKITEEEGLLYTRDEYAYKRFVKGVVSSSDSGGIIAGF
jgi:twitching motility protein PilT